MSVDLSPFGDVARAKALALAITLCKPEGWQRTVFYKVFWRAHLRHMLQHGRALTDWPIVRMPNGPGIEKGPELLAQLAEEGAIVQEIVPAGDHEAIVARVRDHARAQAARDGFTIEERASIKWAGDLLRNVSSTTASDQRHLAYRVWRDHADGDTLPIYADLIVDDERLQRMRDARNAMRDLLASGAREADAARR